MSYFSPKAMKCYAIWHHKRAYNTIIGRVKIETVHFVVGISPDCKKSMSVWKKKRPKKAANSRRRRVQKLFVLNLYDVIPKLSNIFPFLLDRSL